MSDNNASEPLIANRSPRPSQIGPAAAAGGGEGAQLGTFLGVYVPCMLSIFGAILFLRLAWSVGELGLMGTLSVFALAGLMVTLTALSISAISTNGTMKGGGAYVMISRSLGPEFGGSVGIIFYLANAIGVTFYLSALAENAVATFGTENSASQELLVGSLGLLVCLVASLVGAEFFSRLNMFIFGVLLLSIGSCFISYIGGPSISPAPDSWFSAMNGDTLADNMWPNLEYKSVTDPDAATGVKWTYFGVFSVIFPAVTGIMAGANLSGDLADPGKSIGSGTLTAIGSSLIVYSLLAIAIAATCAHEELVTNLSAMQDVAFTPAVVVVGVFCSTFSSGLGALVGAARVLQALARDNLIPALAPFGVGSGANDEPRRAVLLTYVIAQAGLFVGSLDVVASVITNCFLLTYLFTNTACFALRVSGAPNFRPRFRYFSWHTALLGALLCLVVMFLCDAVYASVSILLLVSTFVWILYSAPVTPWGDISQALIFHQVRKYLLRLDSRKMHPKFWRPSILLLMDNPGNAIGLLDFCNNLKKGGLYVLGSVLVGDVHSVGSTCLEVEQLWLDFIAAAKIKAFAEQVIAPDVRVGAQNLLLSAGLGGMKPNTVVLPFPAAPDAVAERNARDAAGYLPKQAGYVLLALAELYGHQAAQAAEAGGSGMAPADFVNVINDTLFFKKNVVVARGFRKLNRDLILALASKQKKSAQLESAKKLYIDVWVTHELTDADVVELNGPITLALQLAHVLHRNDRWQDNTTLRVMCAAPTADAGAVKRDQLLALLNICRVDARVVVIPNAPSGHDVDLVNVKIREQSADTAVIFTALPRPPKAPEEAEAFMHTIEALTNDLPPTALIYPGMTSTIITTEI